MLLTSKTQDEISGLREKEKIENAPCCVDV
jgi:hypothetical protein